jgi:DNA topoisomerase-1
MTARRSSTKARVRAKPTAALRYVHDDDPGFRRRRSGKGFAYLDTRGHPITDAAKLRRIKALAIPPAWTDVWISPRPDGHLQATGRDAKGRKQYRYHPDWRAVQEEMKFDRLISFGEALPAIRRRIADDIARRGLPREKVIATVVHLLEASLIRIGNDEYARTNGSFGLTTLRDPHVAIHGADISFSFPGKSNQRHAITVHDPRTARIVRQCRELPGQRLFQYVDEGGKRHKIESGDINDYLRETTGAEFTAKDFRTWIGTLLAGAALAALDPPQSDTAAKRQAAAAIEVVAEQLGNTPTVARSSYVHPDIVDLYVDGSLPELWTKAPARDTRWMLAEEKRLLKVLRAARRRQRRSGASNELRAAA